MADELTGQEPNDNTTSSTPAEGGDDQGSNESGIEGLPQAAQDEIRRLRGENRAVRRERNTYRDRAKQLEDEGKTEEQRRADNEAAAIRRADAAEARALRFEVAAEVGLPLSLAKRIQGENREEMIEDAKELTRTVGAPDNGGQTDFHGGVRGAGVARPKTMNDLIRQAAGRR